MMLSFALNIWNYGWILGEGFHHHHGWTLSFLEGAYCCNRRLQLAGSSDVTTEERE